MSAEKWVLVGIYLLEQEAGSANAQEKRQGALQWHTKRKTLHGYLFEKVLWESADELW